MPGQAPRKSLSWATLSCHRTIQGITVSVSEELIRSVGADDMSRKWDFVRQCGFSSRCARSEHDPKSCGEGLRIKLRVSFSRGVLRGNAPGEVSAQQFAVFCFAFCVRLKVFLVKH